MAEPTSNASITRIEGSRLLRRPEILATLALSFVVAFLPVSIIEHTTTLHALIDKMRLLFPVVSAFEKKSNFPITSALYFSVMPMMGFIWLYAGVRAPVDALLSGDAALRRAIYERKVVRFVYLGVLSLFSVGALFFVFANSGSDFNILPINKSRIALACFGPLFSMLPFLMVAGAIHGFRLELREIRKRS